jgi:hypothetical protein
MIGTSALSRKLDDGPPKDVVPQPMMRAFVPAAHSAS